MIDELQEGDWAAQKGKYREAYQLYVRLLDGADGRAYLRLADLIREGRLGQPEADDLEVRLQAEVKTNSLDAAFCLGILYWAQRYQQNNLEKAMRMLGTACKGGYPRAFLALAGLYRDHGKEFPFASGPNIVALLKRGFELGSIEAAMELSHIFSKGEIVDKDTLAAFRYLYICGSLGNAAAVKEAKMMLHLNPRELEAVRQEADTLIAQLQEQGVVFF